MTTLTMPRIAFAAVTASALTFGACGGAVPPPQPPPTDGADPGAEPGMPMACTEIGCQSGLVIDFDPTESWPAGAYEIALTIDGEDTKCSGSLPLASCDAPSFQCSTGAVTVSESGCALDAAQHGLAGLQFDPDTRPKAVEIAIRRDGEDVVTASFAPSYKEVQPNGEGCPPVCEQAHDELKVY